jgi:hypothetical protein
MSNDPTYGEKAVGLSFNPGGSKEVNSMKKLYASIIDDLNAEREASDSGERKRLLSVAITEAQSAQMWAVKGITWAD